MIYKPKEVSGFRGNCHHMGTVNLETAFERLLLSASANSHLLTTPVQQRKMCNAVRGPVETRNACVFISVFKMLYSWGI